ncbi:MAG: hypothetical protein NT031_06835 [Planctomycetota bacterium]|nr:hypothetical protein [Planctomycetota bacterium]
MIESFAGKRVTVVGLGRFGGGVGVTRWLASQGARVTVSDAAGREALADSVAQLAGLDVALHLGEHVEADFTGADLLVVNPAVPPEMPLLAVAAGAGGPPTPEIDGQEHHHRDDRGHPRRRPPHVRGRQHRAMPAR